MYYPEPYQRTAGQRQSRPSNGTEKLENRNEEEFIQYV